MELDWPALEVGVKFEHDQGKTQTRGDQQTRYKEIDHKWELCMEFITENQVDSHGDISAKARCRCQYGEQVK